jgi:hypothetical protein
MKTSTFRLPILTCALLAALQTGTGIADPASATQTAPQTRSGPQTRPAPPPRAEDPAASLAAAALQAMGGEVGWGRARFFRFDFAVEKGGKALRTYRHWWDRATGRYRLEGSTREGTPYVVLFNVRDRTGKVWLDGRAAEGETAAQILKSAYGRYINDTYWLLMPFKLRDPGVRLRYEGKRTDAAGKEWEVIHLSFDSGIGLTPGDQYWALLDPVTHLMGSWEYVLEGEKPPPAAWSWEGWRRIGSILLSPDKRKIGDDTAIRFPVLEVSEEADESVFRDPS